MRIGCFIGLSTAIIYTLFATSGDDLGSMLPSGLCTLILYRAGLLWSKRQLAGDMSQKELRMMALHLMSIGSVFAGESGTLYNRRAMFRCKLPGAAVQLASISKSWLKMAARRKKIGVIFSCFG